MRFVSALLFALCANIDNLPIGLAYGLKKIRVPFSYNLLISLLISLGTFLCMEAATLAISAFPFAAAAQLACGLLIVGGLLFVYDALVCRETKDVFDVQPIGLRQCLFLSLTLLLNNAAVGVSAALAQAPVFLTAFFTFFASSFFLWLGGRIGRHGLGLYSDRLLGVFSGTIMILLGVWELFV